MSGGFGGRHYSRCKRCDKRFARGKDHRQRQSFCKDCEVGGWFDEMHNQGCNVIEQRRLGERPIVVAKRIDECPTITIGGVVCRDATDLLYEDSKYKKTYPTAEELNKIRAYQIRKEREIRVEFEEEGIRKERERKAKEKQKQRHLKKTSAEREEEERIRKAGVEQRKAERIKREEEVEAKVLEALQQGVMRKDIEGKYLFSRYEVDKAVISLEEQGKWKMKRLKRYTKEEDEKIIKMKKEGASVEGIAGALGRSYNAIVNRCYRFKKSGRL